MELRLGLHAPATGARADVVVRTRDGACLAEVAGDLLACVQPAGQAGRLWAGGAPVPAETLLGAAPLVHGALLTVQGSGPSASPTSGGLQLHVVSGADAGRVHPLAPGGVVVGREPGVQVRLGDREVSRRHCRLEVLGDAAGARVVDLGSANGTTVDGVPVGDRPLATGAVLRVGDTRLVLTATPVAAPRPQPIGDGHLAVVRPPRLEPARKAVRVEVPAPPTQPERGALPVLAVLAPLVLGLVVWRVTGSTTFLLLTLLSPVVAVGAVVTERRSGRRRGRRERSRWAAQRQAAEQALEQAVRADELDRRARWPDLAQVVLTATGPGPRLWERRRDELALRLGLADQPATVEAGGDLAGLSTTAVDVPVVVALPEVGVLGIAGDAARAVARGALLQAAVLHGPRDLQVVVVAESAAADHWSWARHLPHLAPDAGQDCHALLGLGATQAGARVAELVALLDVRRAEPPGPAGTDRRPVLLVVDGARALRDVPGLVRLLADGPEHGLHTLCVEAQAGLLAPECRATALADGNGLRLRVAGQEEVVGTSDQLAADLAEAAARALAPLREPRRDRTGALGLPPHVRWTDEVDLPLGGDGDDAHRVLARWAGAGRSSSAILGRAADGPLVVDLVRDGPHALVAGTTGSGKSELLQTLIASLALGNRPDELALVLVDYKGGAAFGPCEHLPHVVGLVTDLDGALVERALASLGAELTRREAVLRAAGCKDVEDHRRGAVPGEVLPRLVLVVDEFASLAEELPDFVGGLVAIAQRGRSLGVHLVLATQRPEGVVSADIRANTNLRLCLAVTRDTESRDVLDSPVAAAISRATPGRAWVRTGHAELTAFQSARVGGRRATVAAGPVVALSPAEELGDPLPRSRLETTDGDTDLSLLVRACRTAADRLDLPPARCPWLPPLPTVLVAADLPVTLLAPADPRRPAALVPLAYGMVDVPAEQARRPLVLDLDRDSHLLVLGAARSGRTTVLRSLAGALARSADPDDVHLYAVDGGGALGGLLALPHTGAVVPLEQAARVDRLIAWLVGETARRQRQLTDGGYAGLPEQRSAAGPGRGLPHLLLMIDRWEAFTTAFQDVDAGRLVDQVHRLLREGPAAGVHVVLTADRSGLLGRTASLIEQRLLLRMADPADYAAAGLPGRLVPGALPPGRGWTLTGAPLAVQVALLHADPSGTAQGAALGRLAACVPAATRPPHRVEDLPTRVRLRDLVPAPGLLGVGGDELTPVLADLTSGLLVAGPSGSGRSTALTVLARGLVDLPVVAVAPRPSPLRGLPGCLTEPDPTRLAALLGDGRVAVLLDDVELLTDGPLGPLLDDLVRGARDRGTVVVAAGTTAALLTAYRGAVVDLRRGRHGLLLCPETGADGEVLGVRLPRTTGGPVHPGRGLLVSGPTVTPVQVADPC